MMDFHRAGQAIEEGRVGQVIEIAAGLSPRGWSFKRRYGARITYVETDLPQMLALKRRLLEQGGLLTPGHRLEVLDALADSGPQSLAALVETLDPKLGTAVISEGLMNYFDPATARAVWQRIAAALRRFPHGAYLADIYLRDRPTNPAAALFGGLLQLFVRGRMHLHFRTVGEVEDTMENCGFTQTLVHPAASLKGASEYAPIRGGDAVSVLEARV